MGAYMQLTLHWTKNPTYFWKLLLLEKASILYFVWKMVNTCYEKVFFAHRLSVHVSHNQRNSYIRLGCKKYSF